MTNTQSLQWQLNSVPKDKSYEFISCGECGAENIVAKKDHAVNLTCSTCYSQK